MAPNRVDHLLVSHPVEDAIAAQYNEVVISGQDLELGYLGLGDDDTLDAAELLHFSLDIADCP